jgi:hypothetical protein
MAQEAVVVLRGPQSIPPEPATPFASSYYNNPTLRIDFCHPAYNFPHDTLLTLNAFDHPHGGIHHNTALVACAIVANNKWDGYFTETRDGPRINIGRDGILMGRKYYFHVPPPSGTQQGSGRF